MGVSIHQRLSPLSRVAERDAFRQTETVSHHQAERSSGMGLDDKISNAAEDGNGTVKEGVGDATGDDSLKAEGKADQTKADLKQAGEKVKDAFSD